MKWLHWRIRSVVPLICAGAWRASSIVRREPPATPAPATVRNFRRLRVEVLTGCGSLIVSLLDYPETDLVHGATTPEELTSLCFRGTSCQVASEVNARPRRGCYPRRHAPAAPGARPRDRGYRRLGGGPRSAARHPAPAARRLAGRAPLLRALRHVSRHRRSRHLARHTLPGPSRQPRRPRPPRSALRPVPLRQPQERRGAHRGGGQAGLRSRPLG